MPVMKAPKQDAVTGVPLPTPKPGDEMLNPWMAAGNIPTEINAIMKLIKAMNIDPQGPMGTALQSGENFVNKAATRLREPNPLTSEVTNDIVSRYLRKFVDGK